MLSLVGIDFTCQNPWTPRTIGVQITLACCGSRGMLWLQNCSCTCTADMQLSSRLCRLCFLGPGKLKLKLVVCMCSYLGFRWVVYEERNVRILSLLKTISWGNRLLRMLSSERYFQFNKAIGSVVFLGRELQVLSFPPPPPHQASLKCGDLLSLLSKCPTCFAFFWKEWTVRVWGDGSVALTPLKDLG